MNTALQKLLSWLRSTWRRARVPERSESLFVPPVPPAAIALPSPLAACATVVIPALNEAARIADVVRHALADPATAEVIVVDDTPSTTRPTSPGKQVPGSAPARCWEKSPSRVT